MTEPKLLEASDDAECWYVPGETHIVDVIDPTTGLTAVLGRDQANVLAQYPTAQRISWPNASHQIDLAAAAKWKRDITEIDETKYWYALEILPPVGWKKERGVESFRMSERVWGNLTDIYAQLGNRYFVMTDDATLSAGDIAARVAAFAAANPIPTPAGEPPRTGVRQ